MLKIEKLLRSRKSRPATPEQYYQAFVQSPSGQAVLTDMMKAHHFLDSTFNPNPYETALAEGERNVILRILTILDEQERKFES